MALRPALDLGRAGGADVVQGDMHGVFVGYLLVDQVEEAAELAGTVSECQIGEHMAGRDPASSAGQAIERGVAVVVAA